MTLLTPVIGASSPVTAIVPRYGKFEASFVLLTQTSNTYDPAVNDVDVTLKGPKHTTATVPAFWNGNICA